MKNLFGEEVSTLEFNNNVKKGKKHYPTNRRKAL